ncbi:SH3 domain-containing protein [Flavobacteriaceae bacterium]|nr:SH3 domain-containing protein [Flavobacteriaceae bacterium]
MQLIKFLYLGFILVYFGQVSAQDFHYVTAENGLIVREKADRNSKRIDKLDYATEVIFYDTTGVALTIFDDGEKIDGQWVEIYTYNEAGEEVKGYVFDGYLTQEPLSKPLKFNFGTVSLEFDDTFIRYYGAKEIKSDTIYLEMNLESNFFKVPFRITQSGFDTIEVYQQFNRSVTIYYEGPHCDMINWKKFKTKWIEIPYKTSVNNHKTLERSAGQVAEITFSKEELDQAIKEHCSEEWFNLVKNIPKTTDYPIDVSIYEILFKMIVSNDNESLEKVIVIDVPMEC